VVDSIKNFFLGYELFGTKKTQKKKKGPATSKEARMIRPMEKTRERLGGGGPCEKSFSQRGGDLKKMKSSARISRYLEGGSFALNHRARPARISVSNSERKEGRRTRKGFSHGKV